MTVAALVVAAGRGSRAGGDVPKQYAPIEGQTVLARAVKAILADPRVTALRVVIAAGEAPAYEAAMGELVGGEPRLLPPVTGGADRQASVLAGLRSLAGLAPQTVLIHDGARPFASPALVARVIDAVSADHGAVPTLPVVDTLKRDAFGRVGGTVDRAGLRRVQTPQGFPFAAILAAHEAAAAGGAGGHTDDAAIAERAGLVVGFVEGEEDNLKVTLPGDLARAGRLAAPAPAVPRVGLGFDVHAFGPGDHVTLAGVAIPFDKALKGHSDADVGLHAVTDAIYGALAEGDIGTHFPPSDPEWKGMDSARFLAHAVERVAARGGRIVHADLTIICERPKIGPHRPAMTERLSALIGLAPGAVSVKATTTERLGFTGRGEGIAAQAVVTVLLPGSGGGADG